MSEKEIIDKLWDLLHLNTYLDLNNEMKEKCEIPREVLKRWFENSKSLLDLYNKEKEKNLIFKGATIVSDLENDGIEIKMNADKLVALYNKNYINKDKIRQLKSEIHQILDKNGITRGYQLIVDREFEKIMEEEE